MKNILEFLAVFSFVIILAGCTSKTEEKVVKCTLNQNNAAQNYEIESVYSIYTDGSVVNKVETTEIVTSDDDYVLDYFENYTNTLYTNMNNAYGGYDFNITKEDGKLISDTKVDYLKLDREKLAKDQPTMKSYMNDDYMITFEGIKSMYEQMGATCEE